MNNSTNSKVNKEIDPIPKGAYNFSHKKIAVETNLAPKAIGPYSQAVDTGDFIYTSGQIPIDPVTGLVIDTDIRKQTTICIENLENVLKAANCNLSNIIKTTIFLTDMNDFANVNEIYSTFFTAPFPARSCVEVSALPKGVCIEIEAIAKR